MDNEPLSAITHLIGFFLAIAGLVLVVVFGAKHGNAWHVVSLSIFGSTLILLYLASTIYHFIPKSHKRKQLFRRIDHSMIYVLIAGTYTPVCLVALRQGIGWAVFGAVWGLALIGILLKVFGRNVSNKLSTFLYLAMGWMALFVIKPLIASFDSIGILWLVLGGIFYSVGVIFFVLDMYIPRTKWFGMHEIFHLFVIAGSFAHVWLMLTRVVYI